MLKDSDYETFLQPILSVYTELETELIQLIASKFSVYDKVGGSLEWWIAKLNEMGLLNQEAIELIAKYSNMAVSEVKKAIEKVGYKAIDFESYNKAYENGLIKVNPKNISLTNVINSNYQQLSEALTLIRTKALQGTMQSFNKALTTAYLETQTGLYDYNTSLRKAMQKVANEGITTATYVTKNGIKRNYSMEAVVRMNVMTELNHTANECNELVINELEAEYVAVSQHLGARCKYEDHRNHANWQGKIYKINGSDEKYPNFKDSTGYGLVDGLGGVNCRHTHWAYFPGVSPKLEPLLNSKENNRIYKLTQKQREYERKIRESKRILLNTKKINDDEGIQQANKLLRNRQKELRLLIKNNPELRREPLREQIFMKEGN